MEGSPPVLRDHQWGDSDTAHPSSVVVERSVERDSFAFVSVRLSPCVLASVCSLGGRGVEWSGSSAQVDSMSSNGQGQQSKRMDELSANDFHCDEPSTSRRKAWQISLSLLAEVISTREKIFERALSKERKTDW